MSDAEPQSLAGYLCIVADGGEPTLLHWRQLQVLMHVAGRDGPIRVCDVAQAIALSRPHTSRLLQHLARRGWVTRSRDHRGGDQRTAEVMVTEAGKATVARFRQHPMARAIPQQGR